MRYAIDAIIFLNPACVIASTWLFHKPGAFVQQSSFVDFAYWIKFILFRISCSYDKLIWFPELHMPYNRLLQQ